LAVGALILLQLSVRAAHPPAAATALLIALGTFAATWQDCLLIVTGVVIMTAVGEAARRFLVGEEGEVT
ncbi:MAG TPA: HPP family protein, partial [Methanocella sp.]|nr:HPP family protein [Methanocella sp.]